MDSKLVVRLTLFLLFWAACRPALSLAGDDPASMLRRVRQSVFLVGVVSGEDGSFEAAGTAWTIDRGYLASNAHVAEALRDEGAGAGDRIVAKRGIFDRNEIVLGPPVIHPAYHTWNPRLRRMIRRTGSGMKRFDSQPVADVALLPVVVGDPGEPLAIIPEDDPGPLPGDEVFYAGFPMESMSGFATLHIVPMRVTAITDFFFQAAEWDAGGLLHLSGQTTGGASGSPIIRASDGKVVGILSSGDFLLGETGSLDPEGQPIRGRISIGFTYAQKVDLAIELRDGTAAERQGERDLEWQRVARRDLFAAPDEIILDLVRNFAAARHDVRPEDIEKVAQQRWSFSPRDTRKLLRISLEEGYGYWFAAHSDDGTCINAAVRRGELLLARDDMDDNIPILDVIGRPDQREVVFDVYAVEEVFGSPDVTAHIYRHRVDDAAMSRQEHEDLMMKLVREVGEELHNEVIVTHRHGRYRHLHHLEAESGGHYFIRARSRRGRDIDLIALAGGEVIAKDLDLDHYPEIEIQAPDSEIRIELLVPPPSRAGEEIEFSIWKLPEPRWALLLDLLRQEPGGDPKYETVRLQAGFLPDPRVVRLISGGPYYAENLQNNLVGYISLQPDVILDWSGRSDDLRVFFEADESGQDATLVIHTPGGDWIGNDDAHGNTLNPMLHLGPYGPGRYSIWVGSYFGEDYIPGSLSFTERYLQPR